MIVEYVRYNLPDNATEDFEVAYQRAAQPLAASPACLDYELTRCHEEPARYILRIRWTSLDGHLKDFRGSDEFRTFLAEIGPFAQHIEEMQHYETTDVNGDGVGTPAPPTLYEWAGGAEAFQRLFRRFYDAVLQDELLYPLFKDMDSNHPDHVALWLGEVFGGPSRYTDERGGYANMLAHHVGKSITEPQRRRWVSLLADAADEVGLPDDPEFRAAFMGYVEWGTRLAVHNSARDAAPVEQAPVPHWGWGVAPPWQG
jgi:truncated hemoglobin YjbI/quinol monooxygenase YgiN